MIIGILQVSNTEYGADGYNYKDDGGYIEILVKRKDYHQIKKNTYIDCDDITLENADKMVYSDVKAY